MFNRLFRWRREAPHPISDAWIAGRLGSTRLYTTPSAARLSDIRARCAPAADGSARAAGRYLRHEFDLLGSGPFVPVDPDRPSRDGYAPIDWYLDPVRRLRFPRGIPYKEWKLYEMRPGNADVKYPWELARCQHFGALGQAFLLHGDDRYALEIAREIDDFAEANPIGIGINFTCTMDVAIRALNWAIGLELVHGCQAIDPSWWRRLYAAVYDTGVFTRANLENNYEVTSNHFLSNVVGLWFLGAVFADLPAGQEWLAFARESLEREIVVQVLPDGADYESSIPYHRLVTELFLGSLRLADFMGQPLSDAYRARVRDMVALLVSVTRPDGLMPQAGDADDGRLHQLSAYMHATPQDARHLFGPAGAMFGESAWSALGGDDSRWETAWWGLDVPAVAPRTPLDSRLLRDAGLAVMRAADHYLLASNGIVGTKGFGNHKHNDLLSFEYHHSGVPLVVDPGSYVYTSDFDARNLFRSTASHNTVQIDGEEQNEFKRDWIFRMFEKAIPEHVAFSETADRVTYTGRHSGYARLPAPVLHERTFQFSKNDGAVSIVDRFGGTGDHDCRWHFHLAPGVAATHAGEGAIELAASGRTWRLHFPPVLRPTIAPAAYSPSYGVKVDCLAIDLSARVTLPADDRWEFGLGPA